MSLWVPDSSLKKGLGDRRIEARPSDERGFDGMDLLLLREKEHGNFYIPLNGFMSPVIPILLQMARPEAGTLDEMPILIRLPSDKWLETMQRWLAGHRGVRERLYTATGFRRWTKREDVISAINRAPEEYTVALTLWARDPWCWKEHT